MRQVLFVSPAPGAQEASYHTAKKCSEARDTWLLGGSTLTSRPGCEASQPLSSLSSQIRTQRHTGTERLIVHGDKATKWRNMDSNPYLT